MKEILQRVQVNMPFRMLVDRYLPMVLKEEINPEIGFDCFALDGFGKKDFLEVADTLRDRGLTITFHAPFFDLRPGAIDRKIRNVTIKRLKQVFDLVPYFEPRTVVCHASFDSRYYVANEDLWLENSRETWKQFISIVAGMNTTIVLENVYESDPLMLQRLLDSFDRSDHIGVCFDTGHFNAFSTTRLDTWMDALGSYIGELHLHDNNGILDEHSPVGDGTFPFYELFESLHEKKNHPVITLEPHTEENLWRTLQNIKKMNLLDRVR